MAAAVAADSAMNQHDHGFGGASRHKLSLKKRKRLAQAAGTASTLHTSKKVRKMKKEEAQIAAQVDSARTLFEYRRRNRVLKNLLLKVFVVYVRVLKKAASNEALLCAVLRAMARHTHLVSLDLLGDLVGTLAQILYPGGAHRVQSARAVQAALAAAARNDDFVLRPSTSATVHIVRSVFELRERLGEGVVDLDMTYFYRALYEVCARVALLPKDETLDELLQNVAYCILVGVVERRSRLSDEHAAAFAIRLVATAV